MKGIQGLILALGLGMAGALFNYAYLVQKSTELDMVYFIGIKDEVTLNSGEKLTEEHLVPVGIPEKTVGNLKDFAYLWEAVSSVVGRPVYRTLTGGSLLLRDDIKTPPPKVVLEKNERLVWVSVSSSNFVPSLISPGDEVDFAILYGGPTPAYMADSPASGESASEEGSESSSAKPAPSSMFPRGKARQVIIGPFKILTLGNRLSSPEVWQAWGKQASNENVIGISVRVDETGQLEPKAQTLLSLLHESGFRNVIVMLHPREQREKK